MKRPSLLLIFSAVLIVLAFTFCKKKESENTTPVETPFDKSAMLSNYADGLIIPNLINAKTNIEALNASYETFAQTKNSTNLLALRVAYENATVAFQHISTFEYGPSETEIVRANFNTYPTDTAQIRTNINAGTYNLAALNNLDAKGFPAIDFLLYEKNLSDNAVVDLFTSSAKANERTKYLKDCIAEMLTKMTNVVNGWQATYRAKFIASTSSDIGSSLGLLINQLDFEIDLLKNGKIGIPLGKKSLDVILPEKCEAYYANTISIKLAMECLLNIENVYLGRSKSGNNGSGLDDYLIAIDAKHGTGTLDAAIKNQFSISKQKLSLLSEPLTTTLYSNTAAVNTAYVELVKLLVLLKTDTPSVLGIVITYQDGDGD